jgi:hypothetical protein
MPSIRKLPRNHKEETELLDTMLEMQRLSGKYPEEMLGLLIHHLKVSTSKKDQLRVRNALNELLATMPLNDCELIDNYAN